MWDCSHYTGWSAKPFCFTLHESDNRNAWVIAYFVAIQKKLQNLFCESLKCLGCLNKKQQPCKYKKIQFCLHIRLERFQQFQRFSWWNDHLTSMSLYFFPGCIIFLTSVCSGISYERYATIKCVTSERTREEREYLKRRTTLDPLWLRVGMNGPHRNKLLVQYHTGASATGVLCWWAIYLSYSKGRVSCN